MPNSDSNYLSLAPARLMQEILRGWSFIGSGYTNIFNLASTNRETELQIIEKIASYGKQLGRIGEALEVVIKVLKIQDGQGTSLSDEDNRAVRAFTRLQEEIEEFKKSTTLRCPILHE